MITFENIIISYALWRVFIDFSNAVQAMFFGRSFLECFGIQVLHSLPSQLRYYFYMPNIFYLITQRLRDLVVIGITSHQKPL